MTEGFTKGITLLRGYELDAERQCVVHRKKTSGQVDYCRPLINCQMCKGVTEIGKVNIDDMSTDLFMVKEYNKQLLCCCIDKHFTL